MRMYPARKGKNPTKIHRSREERDQLILAHLDTPRKMASVLWGFPSVRRLGWEEAHAIANFALVQAAEEWPACQDRSFRFYAEVRCRNAILWKVYELKQAWDTLSIHAEEVVNRPDYDTTKHDHLLEERAKLDAVLADMEDGPEKVYLQARLEHLSQFAAWDRAGRPGKWGQHYEWDKHSIRRLRQHYDNTRGGSGNAA